jgi:hypothetical protein
MVVLVFYIVQRKFTTRSDRVKCVDFHPTEPWILCGLYNGRVVIYNTQTEVGTRHSSYLRLGRCERMGGDGLSRHVSDTPSEYLLYYNY